MAENEEGRTRTEERDGRTTNFAVQMISALLALVPLAWGEHYYFHSAVIPGDLGDARFNMYILEHGFRWLSGQDVSFWSAPFFYPATDVVAYSDNLLGSLPFYALFRELHQTREGAFQMWIAISFFLNFVASYWVMRRLGISLFGAMAGSYVFTFGLPVMGQVGHAQLFARFMVPVGIYYWLRFLDVGRLRDWVIALAALLWQIYLGIYTGYFLGMAFVLIGASRWFLIQVHYDPKDPLKTKVAKGARGAVGDFRVVLSTLKKPITRPYLLTFGLFVGGLVPLGIAYGTVAVEMGGRSWGEISSMLPRIASYFRAPQSQTYGRYMNWGQNLPLPWEHMIFIGFVPLLCLILFPVWIRRRREDPNAWTLRILWGVLVGVALLTLDVGNVSLYWPVAHLPGADAIRAVTRFSLVMLFPAALIMAAMMSHALETLRQFCLQRIPVVGLFVFYLVSLGGVALVVTDQLADFPSYPKKETLARVHLIKAEIKEAMDRQGLTPDRVVVWTNQFKSQFFQRQIDTMLAAQELGIPTVNGYSGNVPAGYPSDLFYLAKDNKCKALKHWVKSHERAFTERTLLVVGDRCFMTDKGKP